MNGRLKGTYATLRRYIAEVVDDDPSDVDGTVALQNIMETCRLELVEQSKLGVFAPIREPTRPKLRWCDALIGMQGDGDK